MHIGEKSNSNQRVDRGVEPTSTTFSRPNLSEALLQTKSEEIFENGEKSNSDQGVGGGVEPTSTTFQDTT